MPITDVPILSMLRTRMQWHGERQQVLAENVANADTPGFRPRDLAQPQAGADGATTSGVTLVRTAPGHVGGFASSGSQFRTERRGGNETRPMGNAVNLEDEMLKVAANQMDHQTAALLYSRSLGLLKTALGRK